jgi:hypothetical protein
LAVLILAIGACVPIPAQLLPAERRVIGRDIAPERSEFLQPGVPKVTVAQRLGAPNLVWREKNIVAYDWQKVEAVLVFAIAAPTLVGAGALPMSGHHFLLIRFDAQDRVCHYARVTRSPDQSYGEFLHAWASQVPAERTC